MLVKIVVIGQWNKMKASYVLRDHLKFVPTNAIIIEIPEK